VVTVTVPPRRRRGWGSRPLVFQVFARYLAGRLERPAVLPCVAQTGVLSPVGGDQASVSPVGSPLESRVSPAHIGPSNACHRAAPETTPLWRLFLIKLLSLSLSLRGLWPLESVLWPFLPFSLGPTGDCSCRY